MKVSRRYINSAVGMLLSPKSHPYGERYIDVMFVSRCSLAGRGLVGLVRSERVLRRYLMRRGELIYRQCVKKRRCAIGCITLHASERERSVLVSGWWDEKAISSLFGGGIRNSTIERRISGGKTCPDALMSILCER